MKKQKLILISFFFLIFNNISSLSSDHNYLLISGQPKIIDGDTIKINNKKIRFSGIDAPESYFFGKKQSCILNNIKILCGNLSKEKLVEKIGNQIVICKLEKNKDQYSRLIGECFINNVLIPIANAAAPIPFPLFISKLEGFNKSKISLSSFLTAPPTPSPGSAAL